MSSKRIKLYTFVFILGATLLFSWFWTEGYGISPKYQYGNTEEKALNFWYKRGLSNIGVSKIISVVDIQKDKKLIIYKSNKNELWSGLVRKRWNNKWIVIEQGGGVPLFDNEENKERVLDWKWHNMNEFGLTLGVINKLNVDKVLVDGKDAVILNADDEKVWYFIDQTGSSYVDNKPILDIKAFDENDNLIYSYKDNLGR
ncbi:hypothetical protein ACHOLT_11445 [Desulfitobacterium sp. Sab5]|uniref:hypothetical protein n=1 Tax=Desulfitobacterium nosdiversum TaxID=3375356 RepID=UPI003CF45846